MVSLRRHLVDAGFPILRPLLVAVLFLNPAQLFLHIHGLHLLNAGSVLGRIGLSIIGNSRLLPAVLLLGRYRQAGSAIVDVVALAGETFEVVCDIGRIDCGGVSSLCLLTLFFPSRVEQFN
jgi:hypothetical protein